MKCNIEECTKEAVEYRQIVTPPSFNNHITVGFCSQHDPLRSEKKYSISGRGVRIPGVHKHWCSIAANNICCCGLGVA